MTVDPSYTRRPAVTDEQRATVLEALRRNGPMPFRVLAHRCKLGRLVPAGDSPGGDWRVVNSTGEQRLKKVGELDRGDTRRALQSLASAGTVTSYFAPRYTSSSWWPSEKRPIRVWIITGDPWPQTGGRP